MSKLRKQTVYCTSGALLIAALAFVSIRSKALKAGEDDTSKKSAGHQTVAKQKWSIRSPFSLTRVDKPEKSNTVSSKKRRKRGSEVQLISSSQVVRKQQRSKKTATKMASHVARPVFRQSQTRRRPVRRQKKTFLTKTKEFFTSKIPRLRKKKSRFPQSTRFAQSSRTQTRPRNAGIRFASAKKRKSNTPKKTLAKQTTKTQKSEVIKHLEKLYARDGLPMPEMDMKKLGKQNTKDENSMKNNPFAKLAHDMTQKNLKANPKPIYVGPLNDPNGKNLAGNPFATFDKKSTSKDGNPFKRTKTAQKPAMKLVEQKRISPLKKHMSSGTKTANQVAEKAAPHGFQGYCPVTLKDSRKKIPVNPKLITVYEGLLYTFSTETARKKFLENPTRYTPVMGGSDMIQLIDHGQTVEGSLEHCCWFRGRLYMFASSQSLQTFLNHPGQYATDIVR